MVPGGSGSSPLYLVQPGLMLMSSMAMSPLAVSPAMASMTSCGREGIENYNATLEIWCTSCVWYS